MHKILFPALNSRSLKLLAKTSIVQAIAIVRLFELNIETNSDWLKDCFDNKKELKFSFPLAEINKVESVLSRVINNPAHYLQLIY